MIYLHNMFGRDSYNSIYAIKIIRSPKTCKHRLQPQLQDLTNNLSLLAARLLKNRMINKHIKHVYFKVETQVRIGGGLYYALFYKS